MSPFLDTSNKNWCNKLLFFPILLLDTNPTAKEDEFSNIPKDSICSPLTVYTVGC